MNLLQERDVSFPMFPCQKKFTLIFSSRCALIGTYLSILVSCSVLPVKVCFEDMIVKISNSTYYFYEPQLQFLFLDMLY